MPRVTKSLTARNKHKKTLKATKGHYGARSRLFRTAKQSNIKSLQYAFRDRKNRKRDMRSLWISRINAASKALDISYSRLINSMTKRNIIINRKILSEIAISDSPTFEKIVQSAIQK
jgi:large subunit ribosomal protein L20